jgi:hypothetical protein
MGSVDELARNAGIPIRFVGGLTLVQGTNASAFVDALAAAGVRILGVEGFEVEGSEVRPDMGLIADFSEVIDPGQSASEARRFIQAAARPDVFFEFTIAGGQPRP